MNQTIEKSKKRKKDNYVRELATMFSEHLDRLEQRKENGEDISLELERSSKVCKDWVSSNRFYTDMNLGLYRYQKRINRRATRKPLTLRRLKKLVNEIDQISKILKI